jgi:hypothetical protein
VKIEAFQDKDECFDIKDKHDTQANLPCFPLLGWSA